MSTFRASFENVYTDLGGTVGHRYLPAIRIRIPSEVREPILLWLEEAGFTFARGGSSDTVTIYAKEYRAKGNG
jgi:hypothetical protein